jgi:hypothetical protein
MSSQPASLFAAMLALVLLAPVSAMAQGQGITGSFDADFNDRPWPDVAAHLPKFPDPSDLAEIRVEGEQSTKFLIDLASVDLGSDAVIRFTMLARSASGAESLTYEGIRCSSAERKLYAFGRSNRSWDKALNARWRDISVVGTVNSYHAALYLSYFCQRHAPLKSQQLLVDTIKRGGFPVERGS